MGLKNWYRSQHSAVQAAIILATLGLVGAIAGPVINTELSKPTLPINAAPGSRLVTLAPRTSPSTPLRPAPSTATALPACPAKLHISKPAEDAIIPDGENAAPITGSACDLGGDSGWLFDFDPEDGYYYDDYTGSTLAPAVQSSQSGQWQFPGAPIGDPGDQHKRYTITLVLASPSCDTRLRSEPSIGGDYKLNVFPQGCIVVQQVDVYVTNPQN